MFRIQAAAAVRTRDDLQKVSVRIVEIKPSAIIPPIYLAGFLAKRIGPIRKSASANTFENPVELGFADQKGEMAR
jgi:hypothetical protein